MFASQVAIGFLVVLLPSLSFAQKLESSSSQPDAAEVFQERIMPIFRSDQPSSCVQCHLSSVDLKDYILPSSEQTFVSLRDQGMIDLANPTQSKILELIRMGEDDFDKGARLIHAKVRESEYKAFAAWIVTCCQDKRLINLPKTSEKKIASPDVSDEVIRHGRKGRLVNSFVRNIWSQRLRCFPCHTPHDIKPQQTKARDRFEDFESEYGDRMTLFQKTPVETMKAWIAKSAEDSEDELPLLNLKDPTESLIILKPTAKLPPKVNGKIGKPSYQIPVYHMGGLKMHVNDQSYKSFIAWIKDYSRVESDEYKSPDQLPSDNWFATKRILRLKDIPSDWKAGTTVQLKVHRWQADRQAWSENPMAFTQGTITPRRMVNGALFLLAPTDMNQRKTWAKSGNKFRQGRYLVKVYVDKNDRIKEAPEILLGTPEWVGNVELKNAQWQIGFPKAEMISAKQFTADK